MNEAGEIGLAIGIVVAASLALQSALGPAMNGIVEAVKGAGYAPNGRAGLVSLGIGTGLGLLAGLLAFWRSAGHDPAWIGIGAFAGLVGLGAGGVRSHLVVNGLKAEAESKATKTVERAANPIADAAVVDVKRDKELVASGSGVASNGQDHS